MSVPSSVDEISATWLTDCLSADWPAARVRSVRHTETLHGAATKVRLEVDYEDSTSDLPPRSMWVKIGLEPHSGYLGSVAEVYLNEDAVYHRVLPFYDLNRPSVVYRDVQGPPLRSVLVLEDLLDRGVTFPAPPQPLTIDQTSSGVLELARLHAQSWLDPRLVELGIEPIMSGPRAGLYSSITDAGPALFKTVRAFAAPVALHDPDRFAAAMTAYQRLVRTEPWCLVHGDAHMNNAYVDAGGDVGLLDWQLAGRGRWVHDVAYFVVSALDVPDRRQHERDLLRTYLDALSARGVTPPLLDEAWDDYRRAVFFGFAQWLVNWDSCQIPEYNLAAFARSAAAMVDHDTYRALGL